MRNQLALIGVAVAAGLIVALNSLFVVGQTEQALVLQLGVPQRVINADGRSPGLHAKVPFTQNVIHLDRRNQALEVEREEIITSDQERLVVDAFIRYRIVDPLQYYRTLRDPTNARDQLQRLVISSTRQVLGRATSQDIISVRRAALSQTARADLVRRAQLARLGITVIDVRIRRVDFPASNTEAVYNRMNTALEQRAAEIRFNGERQKREIIGGADRDVTVALATAQADSGQIRGAGDAEATRLYNASFGRDAGFAAFYRSLQAYEASFADSSTTMILSPDSEFFRYFDRGPGGQ